MCCPGLDGRRQEYGFSRQGNLGALQANNDEHGEITVGLEQVGNITGSKLKHRCVPLPPVTADRSPIVRSGGWACLLPVSNPLAPGATPQLNANYQDEAKDDYDEGGKEWATTSDESEQGIVDKKNSRFEPTDQQGLLGDPQWDMGKVDHQHVAIALVIVPASVAGCDDRSSIGDYIFRPDQAGSEQVGTNTSTFPIDYRKNMVGRKMV
jgi:hypothetical protein